MRSSPVLNLLLAVALAAPSSALEIANQNVIPEERGTVAPAQSTDTASSSSQVLMMKSSKEQKVSATFTDTSGSDDIAYVSVWGAPVVAKTTSNHSAAEPTFGKITSGPGECVVAEPTEYISKKYLDSVWQRRIGPTSDTSSTSNWNVLDNKNWIMDHLVHNNGYEGQGSVRMDR
ncbi:hypothetical protein P3T76_011714 [Phytophthora citrophthora]|uniref:Uncharacterized protein n=1 Tax=Phytophthora citrophthora TaxID=4793 RepID=A0AAD9LFZ4_9STRA|nr:hypothetical protein P3T76_011714 [Phytophthora citrophthora]